MAGHTLPGIDLLATFKKCGVGDGAVLGIRRCPGKEHTGDDGNRKPG